MCRERLPEETISSVDAGDYLSDVVDSDSEQTKYVPSAEVVKMQRKMSEVYQQQLQKGGIIDLEAERNKYLIPKVIAYCYSFFLRNTAHNNYISFCTLLFLNITTNFGSEKWQFEINFPVATFACCYIK